MISSQCNLCVHLRKSGLNTCQAFPDGIPDEILYNEISHANPYPNDNGITFNAKPDISAKEIKFLEFGKLADDVVA